MLSDAVNIVFIGPPGAGKGTQASYLSSALSLSHLSTGDLVRAVSQKSDSLSMKLKTFLDSGLLVPDDLMSEMLFKELSAEKYFSGFVLDGFPRTVLQARALDDYLFSNQSKLSRVFYFYIETDLLVRRLAGRRYCKSCGSIFNLEFNPPMDGLNCDNCGVLLRAREDDVETVVRERLKIYKSETWPVVQYYERKGLLTTLCASFPISAVKELLISSVF